MSSDEQSTDDSLYERLAAGAHDLASVWDEIAYGCGDATPPSSQCALEAAALSSVIESPEVLMRAIAHDAVVYVTSANQQLRALARLLGPELVLTGWTVVRTLAEHVGRAAWLLSPEATPTGRFARFYMERIVSVHMARLAAERTGQSKYARELRQARQQLLSDAQKIFPDIQLFNIEELNEWSVGGEAYASLGGAVNDFGKMQLGARGLYDTLSTFTHPSLYRLHAQMKSTELEDRIHYSFVAEPQIVKWQFTIACASLYRAAHYVVGYLAADSTPLESWADRYPLLLSSQQRSQEQG